jgi:hypothetical protein
MVKQPKSNKLENQSGGIQGEMIGLLTNTSGPLEIGIQVKLDYFSLAILAGLLS